MLVSNCSFVGSHHFEEASAIFFGSNNRDLLIENCDFKYARLDLNVGSSKLLNLISLSLSSNNSIDDTEGILDNPGSAIIIAAVWAKNITISKSRFVNNTCSTCRVEVALLSLASETVNLSECFFGNDTIASKHPLTLVHIEPHRLSQRHTVNINRCIFSHLLSTAGSGVKWISCSNSQSFVISYSVFEHSTTSGAALECRFCGFGGQTRIENSLFHHNTITGGIIASGFYLSDSIIEKNTVYNVPLLGRTNSTNSLSDTMISNVTLQLNQAIGTPLCAIATGWIFDHVTFINNVVALQSSDGEGDGEGNGEQDGDADRGQQRYRGVADNSVVPPPLLTSVNASIRFSEFHGNTGTLEVVNTFFDHNNVLSSQSVGAVASFARSTVQHSSFSYLNTTAYLAPVVCSACTISYCQFVSNNNLGTGYGGALWLLNEPSTASHCIFHNNYALHDGAAVYSESSSTIKAARFRSNRAGGVGGYHGAVAVPSQLIEKDESGAVISVPLSHSCVAHGLAANISAELPSSPSSGSSPSGASVLGGSRNPAGQTRAVVTVVLDSCLFTEQPDLPIASFLSCRSAYGIESLPVTCYITTTNYCNVFLTSGGYLNLMQVTVASHSAATNTTNGDTWNSPSSLDEPAASNDNATTTTQPSLTLTDNDDGYYVVQINNVELLHVYKVEVSGPQQSHSRQSFGIISGETQTTFFVDPVRGVSGRCVGTIDSPCRTLAQAAALLFEGDLLVLQHGEYTGNDNCNVVFDTNSTMAAHEYGSAIIRCSGVQNSLIQAFSRFTVDGIVFIDAPLAISSVGTVKRCTFMHSTIVASLLQPFVVMVIEVTKRSEQAVIQDSLFVNNTILLDGGGGGTSTFAGKTTDGRRFGPPRGVSPPAPGLTELKLPALILAYQSLAIKGCTFSGNNGTLLGTRSYTLLNIEGTLVAENRYHDSPLLALQSFHQFDNVNFEKNTGSGAMIMIEAPVVGESFASIENIIDETRFIANTIRGDHGDVGLIVSSASVNLVDTYFDGNTVVLADSAFGGVVVQLGQVLVVSNCSLHRSNIVSSQTEQHNRAVIATRGARLVELTDSTVSHFWPSAVMVHGSKSRGRRSSTTLRREDGVSIANCTFSCLDLGSDRSGDVGIAVQLLAVHATLIDSNFADLRPAATSPADAGAWGVLAEVYDLRGVDADERWNVAVERCTFRNVSNPLRIMGLYNVSVSYSTFAYGGPLLALAATLHLDIERCSFIGNERSILIESVRDARYLPSVSVAHSNFTDNAAIEYAACLLLNSPQSHINITHSRFERSSAVRASVARTTSGTFLFNNCSFTNNTATVQNGLMGLLPWNEANTTSAAVADRQSSRMMVGGTTGVDSSPDPPASHRIGVGIGIKIDCSLVHDHEWILLQSGQAVIYVSYDSFNRSSGNSWQPAAAVPEFWFPPNATASHLCSTSNLPCLEAGNLPLYLVSTIDICGTPMFRGGNADMFHGSLRFDPPPTPADGSNERTNLLPGSWNITFYDYHNGSYSAQIADLEPFTVGTYCVSIWLLETPIVVDSCFSVIPGMAH